MIAQPGLRAKAYDLDPASGTGASSTPVPHPTRPVVPPGGSTFGQRSLIPAYDQRKEKAAGKRRAATPRQRHRPPEDQGLGT